MGKLKFTSEQIENLKQWKQNLSSEEAKNWAVEEETAEIETSRILNDEKFKQGHDLEPETLDKLFSQMRCFSANRNLSNLLYGNNGIDKFNSKLRELIHSNESFPKKVDNFFRLKSIGIQTLSQFLVAADTKKYPFITFQTKDALDINAEQDEAALKDAIEFFNIQNPDGYLDRTLEYLRDYMIFSSIKDLLNLEKYTQVNNLLWFNYNRGEEGPEDIIKSYGSISIEHDLRDYLADNIFIVEKGLKLIKKEFDTKLIGIIDLLCKDKKGNHVVIELKKGRASDKVVGQTLRYLGWVSENLNKKVRGLIIINEPDERLEYALKPLQNLVELKYYKVNFVIKDKFVA